MAINAKEARLFAQQTIIDDIDRTIKSASEQGKFNVTTNPWDKSVDRDSILTSLKTLGFTVKEYTNDQNFWLDITW